MKMRQHPCGLIAPSTTLQASGGLKLDAFVTALVAVRMILVEDGYFGDLWLRLSQVRRCTKDSYSSYTQQ